jgi:MFS transporter, VNT family, synaptic vesicle glycoprotein 2
MQDAGHLHFACRVYLCSTGLPAFYNKQCFTSLPILPINKINQMTSVKRSSYAPRSLDDYLEAAAAASMSSSTWDVFTEKYLRCCTPQRRNPPMRNSVYLRYSNSDNTSTATSDDSDIRSSSSCDNVTGDQYPWRYWLIYLSLGIANSSDASEILCLSYILSIPQFDDHILHHTAWRAGLLAATVFMGMLIGGLVVGGASDSLGRQPLLVTGLAVNSIAGLISAASTDVYLLSACRFIAGLGIGATVPPLFALCSELAPPSSRGFWVTCVASFWMVGSMYVAIVGWVLLGLTTSTIDNDDGGISWWRIFTALCAVPSCLGCVMVNAFVPESPRFLLLQGQHNRSLSVVQTLGRNLNYTGPSMTLEELIYHYPLDDSTNQEVGLVGIVPIRQSELAPAPRDSTLFRPLSMEDSDHTISREGVHQRRGSALRRASQSIHVSNTAVRTGLSDFFKSVSKLYTAQMRTTTWPLQMVWFTLSFGSYGLLTWINTLFVESHLENVYFNSLLFSASNLPGNLLSAILMDKVGRASLLTGSILAASLSLVAFAYVAAHQSSDANSTPISTSWIVLAACSFQCFTIASWNTIDVLSSELFPTSVRSTGMGVCAATGRIGAMLAQFVNGALITHPVRLLLTAAGALFLGAVTPIFLPADQTGRPVQDYTSDSVEVNHIRLSRIGAASGTATNRVGFYESENGEEDLDGTESKLPTKRAHDYTQVSQSMDKIPVTLSV